MEIKPYDPVEGSGYAPRRPPGEWQKHRPLIEHWLLQGVSQVQIVALLHAEGFEVSPGQLRRELRRCGMNSTNTEGLHFEYMNDCRYPSTVEIGTKGLTRSNSCTNRTLVTNTDRQCLASFDNVSSNSAATSGDQCSVQSAIGSQLTPLSSLNGSRGENNSTNVIDLLPCQQPSNLLQGYSKNGEKVSETSVTSIYNCNDESESASENGFVYLPLFKSLHLYPSTVDNKNYRGVWLVGEILAATGFFVHAFDIFASCYQSFPHNITALQAAINCARTAVLQNQRNYAADLIRRELRLNTHEALKCALLHFHLAELLPHNSTIRYDFHFKQAMGLVDGGACSMDTVDVSIRDRESLYIARQMERGTTCPQTLRNITNCLMHFRTCPARRQASKRLFEWCLKALQQDDVNFLSQSEYRVLTPSARISLLRLEPIQNFLRLVIQVPDAVKSVFAMPSNIPETECPSLHFGIVDGLAAVADVVVSRVHILADHPPISVCEACSTAMTHLQGNTEDLFYEAYISQVVDNQAFRGEHLQYHHAEATSLPELMAKLTIPEKSPSKTMKRILDFTSFGKKTTVNTTTENTTMENPGLGEDKRISWSSLVSKQSSLRSEAVRSLSRYSSQSNMSLDVESLKGFGLLKARHSVTSLMSILTNSSKALSMRSNPLSIKSNESWDFYRVTGLPAPIPEDDVPVIERRQGKRRGRPREKRRDLISYMDVD